MTTLKYLKQIEKVLYVPTGHPKSIFGWRCIVSCPLIKREDKLRINKFSNCL